MKIKILDCTLRDGGYVNDWNFGLQNIKTIMSDLEEVGTDIIEIGFLRNEPYSDDRTVFCNMSQIDSIIRKKKAGIAYSVMSEISNKIDPFDLEEASSSIVDLVRIIIWKNRYNQNGELADTLQEGFEYCKAFVDKGYSVSIQPARVEQYSDEEFKSMLDLYSSLNPHAFYVVDSWGTMFSDQVIHYMNIADDILSDNISIGFHGHNNQMQVFSTVEQILNKEWKHDIIIDSSIFGMGRCAGNLNTEIVARYLNEHYEGNYNIIPLFHAFENCIKKFYVECPWGFSLPYYLTAIHHVNPNYGLYYIMNNLNDYCEFDKKLMALDARDKVLFSDRKADTLFKNIDRSK